MKESEEPLKDPCKYCPRKSDLNYCDKCERMYKIIRKFDLQDAYSGEIKLKETLGSPKQLTYRQQAIIANRKNFPFNLIKIAYEQDCAEPSECFLTARESEIARAIVRYFDDHDGKLSYNKIAKELNLSHTAVGKYAKRIAIKGRSALQLQEMKAAKPQYERHLINRKKRDWVTDGFMFDPETNEWMPYFRLIKRKPKGEEFIDISRIKTTRRSPHK